MGPTTFTYIEEGRTFIFPDDWVNEIVCTPGGFGRFWADICLYWCTTPSASIRLTSFLSVVSLTFMGLPDDLKQIARACPEHTATVHYLGCLYLLNKDLDSFADVLKEFYHGQTLPRAFAEGAMVLETINPRKVEKQWIDPATRERYRRYTEKNAKERKSFWYFYKYGHN